MKIYLLNRSPLHGDLLLTEPFVSKNFRFENLRRPACHHFGAYRRLIVVADLLNHRVTVELQGLCNELCIDCTCVQVVVRGLPPLFHLIFQFLKFDVS